MSYCIHPNCSKRINPADLEFCQTCGTKLLINGRYQIVQPLRIGQCYNSEIFEVKDFNDRGTSKVLKSLAPRHNTTKLAELFEKEAQALIWLSSEWQKHPGIPQVKPDGYFTFGIGNGFKKLQCLVMEKIEGQNLEEWLEQNHPISEEQALDWLQQLLEILDKVHRQGFWHRDIKPSNIMLKPDGQLVLIDFGSVGIGATRIVSAEYTPPEQIEGKTVLQSDFFALGRTFVYLLTGRHPCELPKDSTTEQLIWRSLAPDISSNLAQLIDDLMAASSYNRPPNIQEIWQRIQAINNRHSDKKITHHITYSINQKAPKITHFRSNRTKQSRKFLVNLLGLGGATLLLGLAGTVIYNLLPCQVVGNFKPCLAASDDKLSFGEEILTGSATPEKQRSVEAFRDGQYAKAVNWLESARKNQKSDPETLIYLNNAKIEAQKAKAYTIAVVVPLDTSSEGLNSGLEILRGVAQAQDEFNRKRKGVGIKVLIADDANSSEQAKQIAKALVNQKDVVAVVGHSTSDSTLAAAEIYQQNQLVFISPTSTSEDLSAQGKSHRPNFFFRTVPSDRVAAQELASYLSEQANQQKVAIFYNPRSRYSDSLKNQFRNKFSENGGTVVEELDLSNPIIDSKQAIDKARKKGAKVIALFPSSHSLILNKTRKLINANQCTNFMVAGDTIYTPDIFDEVGKEATNCLVVAVPWHSRHSPDQKFPKVAEKLWGGEVSWRTALAYDATRVLIAALEKNSPSNRTLLQKALSDPNFSTNGATGEIHFSPDGNGDRKEANVQLINVVRDN